MSNRRTVLLDEISDPLEALANLVFLLDLDAEQGGSVHEYCRLLTEQLARVSLAAHRCLHPDCYEPGVLLG